VLPRRLTRFLGAASFAMLALILAAGWMVLRDDMPGARAASIGVGDYQIARAVLVGAVVAMALALIVVFASLRRLVERRVSGPIATIAAAAESGVDGDFSVELPGTSAHDEIGRLARGVAAMRADLRRLAGSMSSSARETATMAGEITAGSEAMASAASQIAHTAGDLSHQSSGMAEAIQAIASASDDLVQRARELEAGASEGLHRNALLRALAVQNRARLDQSSGALETLATEAEFGRAAVEELAAASEDVRGFVALVQKLARQSKLLALNAAMEAARAGDHGHGFSVVAEEVRRLAVMSSEAAERTDRVVTAVLDGIERSRTSSERTVVTVRDVLGATEDGSRSFGEIETAVVGTEAWTDSIHKTATAASSLVLDLRQRLDTLSSGTDSFAAAMQEVAASSQQQSASSEQIAAAAAALAAAADKLSRLVA